MRMWVPLLLLLMATAAPSQEWRVFQVTRFPITVPTVWGIHDFDVTRTPDGHLHFQLQTNVDFQHGEMRNYYLRTDDYGHVLTDTTLLDPHADYRAHTPWHPASVGDGQGNVWNLWSEQGDSLTESVHLYITACNSLGQTWLPPVRLGFGASGGSASSDVMDAAYSAVDSSILIAYAFGYYHRISRTGDILEWRQRLPETRPLARMFMHTDYQGYAWAATRPSLGQPADIALYRFLPDSGVEVHYPFGPTDSERWGVYDFAFGPDGSWHALVYHDSVQMAYVQLDSNFVLQEWRTLIRPHNDYQSGSLGVDPGGNCLIVWWRESSNYQPWWALRNAAGEWVAEPQAMAVEGQTGWIHILPSGTGRWVVASAFMNLYVFNYGYPPDTATTVPHHTVTATPLYTVGPNPFSSFLTIKALNGRSTVLRLYDILGREVLAQEIPAGVASHTFTSPLLAQLPSGKYFVSVQGPQLKQTLPMIHVR